MILNIVNPPSLFMLQLLLPCHYSHKSPPPPPSPTRPIPQSGVRLHKFIYCKKMLKLIDKSLGK
jgi:hypothetical protein